MHIFSGSGEQVDLMQRLNNSCILNKQLLTSTAFVNQPEERTRAGAIWQVYEFYLVTGIRNLHLDPAVSSFSRHLRSWTAWMLLQWTDRLQLIPYHNCVWYPARDASHLVHPQHSWTRKTETKQTQCENNENYTIVFLSAYEMKNWGIEK